jgi:CubicO group peptidase (beta-lactamase class C family)
LFRANRKVFKNLIILSTISFISCGGGGDNLEISPPTTPVYTYTWETASPESVGLRPSAVQDALDYAMFNGNYSQSAIIVKDEKIVGEVYRSISDTEKANLINANSVLTDSFLEEKMGAVNSNSLVTSWSMGKSFTSIIFGIAETQGLLSINSRASDYLNEWTTDERRNITIKNLLDMRSGLYQGCYDITEADQVGNCSELPASQSVGGGDIVLASNQLIGCINQEFNTTLHVSYNYQSQDAYYLYSNCDSMLLGEIFYRVTGQDIEDFAQRNLFSKLDITAYWWKDASSGGQDNGNYLTYCCIDMTARDFLKIGQLLLNDGVWNGERILSSSYVKQISDLQKTYGLKFWAVPSQSAGIAYPDPPLNILIYLAGFDGQYVFIDFENKILMARNSLYYPALDLTSERKMTAGSIGTSNFTVTSPTIITSRGTRLGLTFSPFTMARFLYDLGSQN